MLSSYNSPDVFENHGYLFLMGLVFCPSWTLLLASNIKLPHPSLWFLVFYNPDFTLLLIAIYRGYYIKNWFLVLMLVCSICYRDFSRFLREREVAGQLRELQRSNERADETHRFITLIAHISPLNPNSALYSMIQDKLDVLLDISKSKKLNTIQLKNLKRELIGSLDAIQLELQNRRELTGMHSASEQMNDDSITNIHEHSNCTLCMNNEACISASPCRHVLFCEKCFTELQDRDDNPINQCPICRIPIVSWDMARNLTYANCMFVNNSCPSEMYHLEGTMNAQAEVCKLVQYLRDNPDLQSRISTKSKLSSYGIDISS
jgi:hypothetical protein